MCSDISIEEALQEGCAATVNATKVFSHAIGRFSLLLDDLAKSGNYVPASLPEPNKDVLLVVLHNSNAATANTIYQAPYTATITIAQYTGESSHDWDNGEFTDTWRVTNDKTQAIDCALHAVFWLELPEHWRAIDYVGYGMRFTGVTGESGCPVFRHLALGCFTQLPRPVVPSKLIKIGMPIHLIYPHDWEVSNKGVAYEQQ